METVKNEYAPQSCADCIYHGISGVFDFCVKADGMLLMDDDINYDKERDKKCPFVEGEFIMPEADKEGT